MRRGLLSLAALACALLCTSLALARPGGGHTFSGPSSGGSGHGGGGSGGGGEELVFLLVRLVFFYPQVGVPVAVIAVVVFVVLSRNQKLENWDTPHHPHVAIEPRAASKGALDVAAQLERLRALDPDFSRVLFEDFAYRLFASVQRARPSERELASLAPYLRDDVRAALLRTDLRAIEGVVVGALRIERVSLPAPSAAADSAHDEPVRIQLLYEANLTLLGEHSRTLYSRERWTLQRAADVRSKGPGSYERLGCPSCGAPFRASDNRRCEYCGQVVSDGRFTFQVEQRHVLSEQEQPPALGTHVEEQGTDRPTHVAPDYQTRLSALIAKDPKLSVPAFLERVRLIYGQLNAAYSGGDLSPVRALVSDGMFDYLGYWIEAYRAQNLRNMLEQMQVERVDLAKVSEDRYYDAITVRVFASGIDYTLQADSGKWVSGDTKRPRRYSEYWTLIRGAQTRGTPKADATCPNCGAQLKASMAGTCAYCSAHVTNGEFDWVLSKIEQDDVYNG